MIEIKNVSKTYGKGTACVKALIDVSVTINQGEFVAIMGASGSGKSTLLHILGFLDIPSSGSYEIFGTDIASLSNEELAYLRNKLAGFVFQQFHLLRRTSAIENVELPLVYSDKKNLVQTAKEKLSSVGLENRAGHLPNELSGGEQQRVAIARALVNNPVIIFADEPTGNLDTKSEEEIMKIITQLNEQGKTIIMVTHENEIAQHAKRIITMRDGKIISDETKKKTKVLEESDKLVRDVLSQRHSAFAKVEFVEHIKQSHRAIFANKIRSFLSMLGILFGVGAVISMLALGQGAKEAMEERIKTLGSNLLAIRGGSARVRGVSHSVSVTRFTPADEEAIRGLKPIIKRVSATADGSGQVVYKNENLNTRIEGVGFDYGEMRACAPETGRWFTKEEIAGREKVVIVGTTIVEKLFGNMNPIDEVIKINRINFRVIGIAPEKSSAGWRDQNEIIYMPVTTAMYRLLGKDYFDGIDVEVSEMELMSLAKEQIEQLIAKRHHINKDVDNYFHIRDMSEIQEMLSSTTRTMSVLLGSIAAISLLVGGIGIMNIMLVSVTERTREIGLRKAVGARAKDIMTQFLIEAVTMTLSGGFMGILLGIGISIALSFIAGWATKVTLSNIVLATGFSISVGLFFGVWPAQKAAKLDPIEALRYE
ncbi:MAG: ABC transporter permease [Candidatus Omnitrophota bacterium]|nr:ABC transporter permease [Candidatus Omnitrophota bacterium]MBU1894779.1 ABC transporter permease [Candidatus Omnitrophota bacterium]